MKILNTLDMTSQKVVNLADPSASTDAANKQYVDNVARGLQWKAPVRAASTANVTLATPGASIDGVVLAANDRILLKNQTTASENGIWVWASAVAALSRALDADTAGELSPGTAVTSIEGTVNADKVFQIISDAAITIGTTSQTWGQLGGGGSTYTGSNGILLTGSNFTAVAAPSGGVTVGATGISIDTSVVARKVSTTIGTGALTNITVTHNLGTKDVVCSLRESAGDAGVLADFVSTDINSVTFSFATAPASNSLRATIIG
jgi:hypothetical protein